MDEKKGKIENEFYSDGCKIEKIINNNGDVITENYYAPSGILETTFKYVYDSEGICIEESEFNSKGELRSQISYKKMS